MSSRVVQKTMLETVAAEFPIIGVPKVIHATRSRSEKDDHDEPFQAWTRSL